MRYTFIGKNFTINDVLKEKVTNKINRIERLFPDSVDVHVTMSYAKNDQTIEVTIPLKSRILRAEATSTDTTTAIDAVVDILEKQMVKYKGQLKNRSHRDAKFQEEATYFGDSINDAEESGIQIEKSKKFALKPMDSFEAVMEMDMLNHNFYVFRNADTDEVNVVYKRKGGSYGLIEPEI